MIKVLRGGDYPGLLVWAQCNHKGSLSWEGRMVGQKRRYNDGSRGGSNMRKGP